MLDELTHTLVEFSVASEGHSRLVSPVDTINVVALDGLNLIHSHIAGKRHLREISCNTNIACEISTVNYNYVQILKLMFSEKSTCLSGRSRVCPPPKVCKVYERV